MRALARVMHGRSPRDGRRPDARAASRSASTRTLMHLSEAPDRRMRMSELAAACDLSLSGMTRIVTRLETAGPGRTGQVRRGRPRIERGAHRRGTGPSGTGVADASGQRAAPHLRQSRRDGSRPARPCAGALRDYRGGLAGAERVRLGVAGPAGSVPARRRARAAPFGAVHDGAVHERLSADSGCFRPGRALRSVRVRPAGRGGLPCERSR